MSTVNENLEIKIYENQQLASTDIEGSIYDLNKQIDMLSPHADNLDYFVAVASGIVCGMMDVLWVGDFNLARGREFSSEQIEELVKKTSHMFGCKDNDLKGCVKFLEEKFPLAADGNTPDFGGGLQHHLRDFAHHPTIIGLIFSLLTQFTEMSYGTDTAGVFKIVPVPSTHKNLLGTDIPDKLFRGTVIWFFHLVSDVAGSSSTAGLSGGTGIPGPLLSLAKEISSIPCFKNAKVKDMDLSLYFSKLFNGTAFAQHDANGKIIKGTEIKFDFRGELGIVAELGRQAIPVIANDCIVRSFYFIRRLGVELKATQAKSFDDIKGLNWSKIKPFSNPTIDRMLTIATGVFTAVDVADAVITKKYFVSVNYIGLGRFTVALGKETVDFLKVRDVKKIKNLYEKIELNTFTDKDNQKYKRMEAAMEIDKFGLTIEQTEILYNLEMYKTINDIECTNIPIGKDKVKGLKAEWIEEWKKYMELGFPGFVNDEEAKLHWFTKEELIERVKSNSSKGTWFRLVLLEAMLFEPYYALSIEKDKKGNDIPSKKYESLHNPVNGYKKGEADKFLEEFFSTDIYEPGYIKRLRTCYNKVTRELNEVVKTAVTGLAITAIITIAVVITAGALAPTIAVALVGSNFAGLSGAALTSACLAYLGGGAIAVGGLGMAGGTAAIVGGGALLGLGVGAAAGGATSAISILGKKNTILQSAKLMTSFREIFLNDEHDVEYSNTIYEQYVKSIEHVQIQLSDLQRKENVASKEEKKQLKLEIKNTEESIDAMMIAMKSMKKYQSAFEIGLQNQ